MVLDKPSRGAPSAPVSFQVPICFSKHFLSREINVETLIINFVVYAEVTIVEGRWVDPTPISMLPAAVQEPRKVGEVARRLTRLPAFSMPWPHDLYRPRSALTRHRECSPKPNLLGGASGPSATSSSGLPPCFDPIGPPHAQTSMRVMHNDDKQHIRR